MPRCEAYTIASVRGRSRTLPRHQASRLGLQLLRHDHCCYFAFPGYKILPTIACSQASDAQPRAGTPLAAWARKKREFICSLLTTAHVTAATEVRVAGPDCIIQVIPREFADRNPLSPKHSLRVWQQWMDSAPVLKNDRSGPQMQCCAGQIYRISSQHGMHCHARSNFKG